MLLPVNGDLDTMKNKLSLIFAILLILLVGFFLVVLFDLSFLREEINDFLSHGTGLALPWYNSILFVSIVVFIPALLKLVLLVTGRQSRAVRFEVITMAVILVIWSGLLAALLMEGGNMLFMKPVTGYKLPGVLQFNDGAAVVDLKAWQIKRRSEVLELFEKEVYGPLPDMQYKMTCTSLTSDGLVLKGKALRREVRVSFETARGSLDMDILLYLPLKIKKPVPVFLGLNFFGNHSVSNDPGITLSKKWMPSSSRNKIVNHRATEASRGTRASRWPVEQIIDGGYGLAVIYCGDLDPDNDDGFLNGLPRIFYDGNRYEPGSVEWGSITAWAWGLSRAMDYCALDSMIDEKRVILMGHSRLGKTSLWAGALDERFAVIISNNSGCMGAALSRRRFGETVTSIIEDFPHWFNGTFKKFRSREEDMKVDQHMLLALAAPRPLYVASASNDFWADPEGEFLALQHASPVYELFGLEGLPVKVMPPVNKPVMSTIGYHVRRGKHDVTSFDWAQFIKFADMHFNIK